MARAKQEDEWDRVAWLCFWMPSWSGRKGKQPKDFHPFYIKDASSNLKKLDDIIASKVLPEKLTEEEMEIVFKRYAKKE
jgi:hypothetical protein